MDIYVGNLDYKLDEYDLRNIFQEYSSVSDAKIITDKYNNGRSKGFGFITMDSNEEAKDAINKLNGSSIKNREIIVKEARQK